MIKTYGTKIQFRWGKKIWHIRGHQVVEDDTWIHVVGAFGEWIASYMKCTVRRYRQDSPNKATTYGTFDNLFGNWRP